MRNNTKRWLVNFLGGRQSHVSFNGKSSNTRNFHNRIPHGSFCHLTLSNFYIYDNHPPPTPANVNMYADRAEDNFIITSTQNDIPTATKLLKQITDQVQHEPTESGTSSQITKKQQRKPQPSLDQTDLPHKHFTTTISRPHSHPTQTLHHNHL